MHLGDMRGVVFLHIVEFALRLSCYRGGIFGAKMRLVVMPDYILHQNDEVCTPLELLPWGHFGAIKCT